MNDLISVIVPVYNVQEYLNRCVESIVNQTYKNLEIILVDDGSPDKCPQMCDEWAEKDRRIKVIHKENGGLSDARNVGMSMCTGDYLFFVDSDDYTAQTAIEELYNSLAEANCDLAVGAYNNIYPDKCSTEYFTNEKFVFTPDEYWIKYHNAYFLNDERRLIPNFVVVWGKLYKKEHFNEIAFPKGKIHEDEFTTYKAIFNAKRIVFVDKPLYFYVHRDGSIMQKELNEENFVVVKADEERSAFFEKHGSKKLYELSLIMLLQDLTEYYIKAEYYIKNDYLAKLIKEKFIYYYRIAVRSSAGKRYEFRERRLLFKSFIIDKRLYRLVRKAAKRLNKPMRV